MQENKEKLPIPVELFHPFFFSEKETCLDISDKSLISVGYFYYELLFYNGIEAKKPWTSPDLFLPQIHKKWDKLRIDIEELHHHRKKSGVTESIKKSICIFLEYLYWSNEKPVCLKDLPNFADLKIKPVNLEERVGFIISRPSLYQSFIQLCEMMMEQEKLFAKNTMIKKASSRNHS